jgi:predicted component of type VI protein secretion system
MPTREQKSSLQKLLDLRKNLNNLETTLAKLGNRAIERHVAGELDPGGHTVEIIEKAIEYEIRKFLVIDGEG